VFAIEVRRACHVEGPEEALTLKWMLQRQLRAFERTYDDDASFIHEVLDTDLVTFMKSDFATGHVRHDRSSSSADDRRQTIGDLHRRESGGFELRIRQRATCTTVKWSRDSRLHDGRLRDLRGAAPMTGAEDRGFISTGRSSRGGRGRHIGRRSSRAIAMALHPPVTWP
jgi:hypothetical protein